MKKAGILVAVVMVVAIVGWVSVSLVSQKPQQQTSPVATEQPPTPKETVIPKKPFARIVISPQEAYALITTNKGNPGFVILDVRSPEEYATGHLENAINIDFYIDERTNNSRTFRGELNKLDKNKTYLVYCLVDFRSRLTSDIMEHLGFREVYDMAGGIVQWNAEGLPTTK